MLAPPAGGQNPRMPSGYGKSPSLTRWHMGLPPRPTWPGACPDVKGGRRLRPADLESTPRKTKVRPRPCSGRRLKPMSSSHYAHGTDPAEQQRLTAMNRLLNDAFVAQAGLAEGERVLDFGAGLGQLSRAMAKVT